VTQQIGIVLAVDDNPDDLRLLQFAWRAAAIGTPLEVLQGGEETIDYLELWTDCPQRSVGRVLRLVLLDLKMPRKDGFEVLQWIRAQPAFKSLPVIVLTASLHKQDIQRAFDMGANAFLVKPVELKKLTEMVRSIELFWLQQNQAPQGTTV
jgi:CheY-like chemotaxis protein